MEMNDILNGLNSCDDDCCDSMTNNCSCGPNMGGFPGGMGCNFGPGFGGGNTCGCGFGSWIWILLILFYCGCGKNFGRVGNNCCCEEKHDCCCGTGNNGGFLSNCSPYLFVLVILFLCNNNFNGCGVSGPVCPGINPCMTGC